MATENKVTAIGTTTIDGETKVRYTSDLVTRSKSWTRNGVVAELLELPQPMTRLEALYWLQNQSGFQTPDRGRAIMEQIVLKETIIKRDERRAKRVARKNGTSTFSLTEIRNRKVEEIS